MSAVEHDLGTRFERLVLERLDTQDTILGDIAGDLSEVKTEVRELRKDVAKLRRWRARMEGVRKEVAALKRWRLRAEGVRSAYRWVEALGAAFVAAGATALVALLVH